MHSGRGRYGWGGREIKLEGGQGEGEKGKRRREDDHAANSKGNEEMRALRGKTEVSNADGSASEPGLA